MDKDLVCRTGSETDEVSPDAPAVLANQIDRPDLPLGSPERREFYAWARQNFDAHWKAAEEAVARERLAAKGDLYFIRAGGCVKIGHTVNIVNRLGKMQADNHERLDCLLLLRDRGHEEPEWHKRFKRHHIRGEWFRWAPEIEDAIAEIVSSRIDEESSNA